jgi:ubiquinone/menaquinone biosynthesis C-methylase UbiE
MPPHRDLAAFERRAPDYDAGWLGRMHHEIADRTLSLALATTAAPQRILDVGCGTGYLLRRLATFCGDAIVLAGVDPAPAMIEAAKASADDERLGYSVGVAEHLPYPDDAFDLVVSTTSFDHWPDQGAGLLECARVLAPRGRLVLVDQFSSLLLPTFLMGRAGKARTRSRADRLLAAAGFGSPTWHDLSAVIIKGVTASMPAWGARGSPA